MPTRYKLTDQNAHEPMKPAIQDAAETGHLLLIFVVVLLADVVYQLVKLFGG